MKCGRHICGEYVCNVKFMLTTAPGHIFIALSSYEVYTDSCLICACVAVGPKGIYMAFEGHIFSWHIYGYIMVNKVGLLFLLNCMCSNVRSTCRVQY